MNSLQILRLYTCLDQIQHFEWSADSLFILCAMYKRGLVQVGARVGGRGPGHVAVRTGTCVPCPSGWERRRCSQSQPPLAARGALPRVRPQAWNLTNWSFRDGKGHDGL